MKISDLMTFFKANNMIGDFAGIVSANVTNSIVSFSSTGKWTVRLGKPLYLVPDPVISENGAVILGINVITSNECAATPAKSPSLVRDPIAPSQLAKFSLVICDGEGTEIARIPLSDLYNQNGRGQIYRTYITEMSVESSYLVINDTSGLSASNAVWLKFFYTLNPKK